MTPTDPKDDRSRDEIKEINLQLEILRGMTALLDRTAEIERVAPDTVFNKHLPMKVLRWAPLKVYQNLLTGLPREEALPDALLTSDLDEFAERSIKRLRTVHSTQLAMAWIVFGVLVLFVVAGAVLFFMGRTTYSVISGTSGIGGFALAQWKWQPFDRATKALRVADCFDSHRVVFRRQLADVEQLPDIAERMMQRQKSVVDFNKAIAKC